MTSLDNIWDEEIETTNDPPPLFMDSDTEDAAPAGDQNKVPAAASADPEFDDYMAALDEITNSPSGRIDIAGYEKQANARSNPRSSPIPQEQAPPSSSPTRNDDESGARRDRKKIMRLDENRLLGPQGFQQLSKDTKDFRIKGKGHESTDLSRLLQIYQFWTHRMYPKTQFRDTVQRVEKLCHSKRMTIALSVWRDEAHPKANEPDSADELDEVEGGTEPVTTANGDKDASKSPSPTLWRPSSSTSEQGDETGVTAERSESQKASSRLEKEVPLDDFDDFDMDIFSNEPETANKSAPLSNSAAAEDMDFEEEWNMLGDFDPGEPVKSKGDQPSEPKQANQDDIDDMYL